MRGTRLVAIGTLLLLCGSGAVLLAEAGHFLTGSPATLLDPKLESADAGWRLYGVKMLGRLAAIETDVSTVSGVLERLERSAADSNQNVAAQARRELERLMDVPAPAQARPYGSGLDSNTAEEQVFDLGAGLGAPDPGYRLYIVKALGRLARSDGPPLLAVALLEEALQDRSFAVATQAEAELAKLEGAAVATRPAIRSDVEDYAALYFTSSDPAERLRAVKRLTAMARRHKPGQEIAQVLKAAQGDRNADVAAQARSAVASLEEAAGGRL